MDHLLTSLQTDFPLLSSLSLFTLMLHVILQPQFFSILISAFAALLESREDSL